MWNIELRLLSNGRGITSGNTAVPSELNSVATIASASVREISASRNGSSTRRPSMSRLRSQAPQMYRHTRYQ